MLPKVPWFWQRDCNIFKIRRFETKVIDFTHEFDALFTRPFRILQRSSVPLSLPGHLLSVADVGSTQLKNNSESVQEAVERDIRHGMIPCTFRDDVARGSISDFGPDTCDPLLNVVPGLLIVLEKIVQFQSLQGNLFSFWDKRQGSVLTG